MNAYMNSTAPLNSNSTIERLMREFLGETFEKHSESHHF